MTTPLDVIRHRLEELAGPLFPAGSKVVAVTRVPRGTDPFIGGDRPLCIAAVRLAAVSPGGIIVGGRSAAVAAVLGVELPAAGGSGASEAPGAGSEDGAASGDGSDGDAGADAAAAKGEAEAAADAEADADAAKDEADAEGADGSDADADEDADADADGDDAENAAAGPAAGRQPTAEDIGRVVAPALTTLGESLLQPIIADADLPTELAPPRVTLTETPSVEVGPLPDAVMIQVRTESGEEARIVVVIPGIVVASLDGTPVQGEPEAPLNGRRPSQIRPLREVPVEGIPEAAANLVRVPLETSIRFGRARKPLGDVLSMQPGSVMELAEEADAPVWLVVDTQAVATGDIEVDDHGNVVFVVGSIVEPDERRERPQAIGAWQAKLSSAVEGDQPPTIDEDAEPSAVAGSDAPADG